MYFSRIATVLAFAATALTAPIEEQTEKRAAAGVLTAQSYAQFQVSDGTAGNALAEVMQKFPVSLRGKSSMDLTPDTNESQVDFNNPTSIAPADLDIINTARTTAEDAETQAFNPAIAAASGDAATALQNGKVSTLHKTDRS